MIVPLNAVVFLCVVALYAVTRGTAIIVVFTSVSGVRCEDSTGTGAEVWQSTRSRVWWREGSEQELLVDTLDFQRPFSFAEKHTRVHTARRVAAALRSVPTCVNLNASVFRHRKSSRSSLEKSIGWRALVAPT